jgi:hypothetical protein
MSFLTTRASAELTQQSGTRIQELLEIDTLQDLAGLPRASGLQTIPTTQA